MKFLYLLVWSWEWFGDLLFICWCCISCCKLCFVIKWLSPPFHLSMSLHGIWDIVVVEDDVLFSRVVSRAAMDIIFRGTYRAPRRLLLIEGRVVRRDRCMDRYVPHGSRTERQRVCIVREDMHHYTWHCISWHYTFYYWWTWTCVLLILWVFPCEAGDCWILSCYWECVNW